MSIKSSVLVCLSILLIFISCCLPAVEFETASRGGEREIFKVWWGYALLMNGPIGIAFGITAAISWFANIIYLVCLVLLVSNKFKQSIWFSLGGALLGLLFPVISYIEPFPADEGSVVHLRFHAIKIGYVLWVLSFYLLLIPSVFEFRKQKTGNKVDQFTFKPNK